MTQTEQQAETGHDASTSLFSAMRQLLPPDETLQKAEQHLIRSGVELLKSVRTIVDSYMERLESCEDKGRPERVSRIEITEQKP